MMRPPPEKECGLRGCRYDAGSGFCCTINWMPISVDLGIRKESIVIVIIAGRHMDVGAPLKTYAETKASKLTKYYDRIQEIEVVFESNKDLMKVEMIVHAEHRNMFIASLSGPDAYACVDGCMDKLERQLTDHKKKFRNRKHPGVDPKRDIRAMPETNLGEAV